MQSRTRLLILLQALVGGVPGDVALIPLLREVQVALHDTVPLRRLAVRVASVGTLPVRWNRQGGTKSSACCWNEEGGFVLGPVGVDRDRWCGCRGPANGLLDPVPVIRHVPHEDAGAARRDRRCRASGHRLDLV